MIRDPRNMAEIKKRKPSFTEVIFREWRLTGALVAVLVLGAAWLFFVGPLLDTARRGGPLDGATLAVQSAQSEAKLKNQKDLIASYAALSAEVKTKLITALPDKPEVPALIAGIDAIVAQAGMQTVAMDIKPVKDGLKTMPEVGVLNIALNVSGGDYSALKRLLAGLEHTLRIADVLALSFSPENATYSLNARVYYLKSGNAAVNSNSQ